MLSKRVSGNRLNKQRKVAKQRDEPGINKDAGSDDGLRGAILSRNRSVS